MGAGRYHGLGMDALRQRKVWGLMTFAEQRPRCRSGPRLRLLQESRCAKTHTKRTSLAIAKRVGTKREPPLPTSSLFLPNKTAFCKSTEHRKYRHFLPFGQHRKAQNNVKNGNRSTSSIFVTSTKTRKLGLTQLVWASGNECYKYRMLWLRLLQPA